jgi:hypothetical protein
VERGSLIRIRVLCELLAKALEEVDDPELCSPELPPELRALAHRATAELDQFADLGCGRGGSARR